MKYIINPVHRQEAGLRIRSVRFALTVFLYDMFLVGIALFGFEIVFNVHWNRHVDYSGASLVYLILIALETTMVVFMLPVFTAGSIAGEREKQTLDILMTTVISPRQIILGKLTSSISVVMLLVISSLPILSIVFTVGGVDMADLFHFVLFMLITSIFIGSIGILASAMFQKTVHATVFSFGMVLVLCVGTIAVVVVVYLLQQMYYWNIMQGKGAMPKPGGVSLLLLFNPIATVGSMIIRQYGHNSQLRFLVTDTGGLSTFFAKNWFYVSILAQMLCSAVLLWKAEKVLDPLRKPRHGYRRKKRKRRAID